MIETIISAFAMMMMIMLIGASSPSTTVMAFSPAPPVLGIGAILFKPRNIKIIKSSDITGGDEINNSLTDAGKFFVDAFWTGKIGGAKKLSSSQSNSLERQQIMEFKKRYYKPSSSKSGSPRLPGNYAGRTSSALDSRAELILCLDGKGDCIGCAGVEVEKIKKMDGYDGSITAPLMSNLAISKQYRRKGLAEDLVKAAESIARREWGYDECYLYVEKRNAPAIKLYKKLGYATLWEDDTATTLLPTEDGRVVNGKTTIVCMKKRLGGGLFGSLFGS